MAHPGHNDVFEINTASRLAIRYNDVSVLEHMHSSFAFEIMRNNTDCDWSRRAAAGRAELLAKKRHTDRLQNPAKLRRFRIGGGGDRGRIGGRIIRDFRKMLHFGKIPKKFGQIWRKFSKILAKFANFWEKNSKNFSNF